MKFTFRVENDGPLARWTTWRWSAGTRRAEAIMFGHEHKPMTFVAGEVLVDPADAALIETCLSAGGELVPWEPLRPPPPEILRLREINDAPFPLPARIRFAKPPRGEAPDEALAAIAVRGGVDAGEIVASSVNGGALAGFAARHALQGRGIDLNFIGKPQVLALRAPMEVSDPSAWLHFKPPMKIIEAWQLLESRRAVGSVDPLVWVAVIDQGFWLQPSGMPVNADFGPNVVAINLMEGPIGTRSQVRVGEKEHSPWHGNIVAGIAAAVAGDSLGIAGTGGPVARPLMIRNELSVSGTVESLRYCQAWGLEVAVMSYAIDFDWAFWGHVATSAFTKAFESATQNGVIVVTGAGNDNWKLPDAEDIRPATRTPGVITVGAVGVGPDGTVQKADFSNWGPSVEIWAPGVNLPTAAAPPPDPLFASGTSVAAPFVGGVIALLRAVDSGLRTDSALAILQQSGWYLPGYGVGIDAHAALLKAMGGRLPRGPGGVRELLQVGPGGRLQSGTAAHNAGVEDTWRFTLAEVSSVWITLDWYHRLGSLFLNIEAEDSENYSLENVSQAFDDSAATPGKIKVTLQLGPGAYSVNVRGQATTAYELVVVPITIRIERDRFEPNDSFANATPLVFEPFQIFQFLIEPFFGPGDFDLTLHWGLQKEPAGLPIFGVNADYFRLDVPAETDRLKARVYVSRTDYPVDLTLFDAAYQVLGNWPQIRSQEILPPQKSTCYLKVDGGRPTRYNLQVLRFADLHVVAPEYERTNELPPWWKIPKELVLERTETRFAVLIPSEARLRDSHIRLSPSNAGVEAKLLDSAGHLVRVGSKARDGHLLVGTADLEPGLYMLSVTRSDRDQSDASRRAGPTTVRLMSPVNL